MKYLLSFFILNLIIFGSSNARFIEGESIFERNFKISHQEPPPPPSSTVSLNRVTNITVEWIKQKLDNFNKTDNRTWNMRYMSNREFYKEGGPLFIFVGGEWKITRGYLQGGHMYDMAREHNGYMFYTEHRYYGESEPTSNLSTENLRYLHVRQALADLAHFIRTMKATIPGMTNSKVILVGGSYSASMVTWFRKLYPDLATGSWASSAPLLAKVDFFEYKEITGQSIKLVGGEECESRIRNGINEMEEMFDQRRGAEVKSLLKICDNFDEGKELDVWTLFSEISDTFAGLVQGHSNNSIQKACDLIMEGDDDLTGLATYLMKSFNTKECNDFSYESAVLGLNHTSFEKGGAMRQWFYQTCNEYGWYQTSTSEGQPFGTQFPIDLYTALCADIFGDQFTTDYIHQQVEETNKFFGGLQPNISNVFMSHGQLDPWRGMGIQNEKEATVIPMYAHCKDLGSISSADSKEMRDSKEKIAELVREWIAAAV